MGLTIPLLPPYLINLNKFYHSHRNSLKNKERRRKLSELAWLCQRQGLLILLCSGISFQDLILSEA